MQTWWQRDWVKISIVFVIWQIVVWSISWLTVRLDWPVFAPSYSRSELISESTLPQAVSRLTGFDGVHYQTIVTQGYDAAWGLVAFFPLYPLLIWCLTLLGAKPMLAGLLVSSGCWYGFLLLVFQLAKSKYGRRTAWWFVWTMVWQPVSFFAGAYYTESLFLLLLTCCLVAYERKKYGWCGWWALLMSATRVVGVLIVPALIVDYLWQKRKNWGCRKDWLPVIQLSVGLLGLLAYMGYLTWSFDDPVAFMTVQDDFGSGRQTSQLVLLPQVFFRYGKMLWYGLQPTWKSFAIVQELVITLFYLFIVVVTAWQNNRCKKFVYPLSWWLFSVGILVVPTLTGHLSSMPRYLLPCLVVNLYLARLGVKRPYLVSILLSVSALLMALNLMLFVQGYWVA